MSTTIAISDAAIADAATDAPAQSTVLQPGETLDLEGCPDGHEVAAGKVEIYAVLLADGVDGAGGTGRHFLFELGPGDLIPPHVAAAADGVRLMALASQAATLKAVPADEFAHRAAAPDSAKALAAALDRWLGPLLASAGRMAEPPPIGAQSIALGEPVRVEAGSALAGRDGVVWLADARSTFFYGAAAPAKEDEPAVSGLTGVAALAPGLWLTLSPADGRTIAVETTLSLLGRSDWLEALDAVQRCVLSLLGRQLDRRRRAALEKVETRTRQTGRTLRRALRRFEAVLGPVAAEAGPAAPSAADGPAGESSLAASIEHVAALLSVDLTNRQREILARAGTIEAAARAVRLRNRTIALPADWLARDLGPLIGFLDEARRPVTLVRERGRWCMIDGEGARPVAVDRPLAARLAPLAEMLYRPMPERALGFGDFVGFALTRSVADVALAVAMAVAGALLGLATPLAMRLAFDQFIPGHEPGSLATLAAGLALAAVIAACFRIAFDLSALRIDGRSAGLVQAAILDRVLRLPDYALRLSPGDLASRVGSADGLRRTLSGASLGTMSAFCFFTANVGLMFFYSASAALAALGLFVLLSLLAFASGKAQLKALMRGEELVADIYSIVFQLVQGINVLRSGGAEQRAFARWGADFAELRTRTYRGRRVSTAWETVLAAFELLSLAAILWIVAGAPREQISSGVFVSFISAYGAYMGASLQIARASVALLNAKPSWSRLAPLLKAVPESAGARRYPGTLTGAIDLTGVYFRYGTEAPYALQGLNLSIAPGEFVALVGPSGAGKSTVMRLLLGFEMPLSGTLQYDHQDLRFLDLELVRRQIGVVLQNSALFPGSLYENIMGVFEGTMDDAWEAARGAGIEADIRAMPMGMHTVVGDATTAFSGGQIQRIALARALVAKPRILLLDEATSAVDNVAQAAIAESLERLAVTRLVIAHRLSTVKKAHRIVVLNHGKVEQAGRYDDLVSARGLFAEIARRQLI